MSEVIYADPDQDVSAMCHRNHVRRAWVHEQEIPDAQYEPVRQEPRSGSVICILEKTGAKTREFTTQVVEAAGWERVPDASSLPEGLSRMLKRMPGTLARWGAGVMFLCGVADGLIDTTYGLMLTIICIGWGLIHLLKVVAHG